MSQAIKVALQKHVNGTFDIIYRNDMSSVITDTEQQANLAPGVYIMPDAPAVVRQLISGVVAGVQKQYINDGYKDESDKQRAEVFLDEISSQFGLLSIGTKSENSPLSTLVWSVGTVQDILFAPRLDVNEAKAIITKIESVHMSGSVVANDNVQQLRGLVTITYRKMDGLLGKVRLSGQLPTDVGIALRQPYLEAMQRNEVTELSFLEPIASGELKTTRPSGKVANAPVKPKEVINYAKLSPEDKEEIADMVARKLIQAMTGSSFLNKPTGHRDVYRNPNHKSRARAN